MPGTLHAIASRRPPVDREPSNPHGFKFSDETESPYLNAEEGARYLRMFVKDAAGQDTTEPNVQALYKFLKRHGITPLGDRRVLVDRRELDAALHPVKGARAPRPAIARLQAAAAGTLAPDTCIECGLPTHAHLDARGGRRRCADVVGDQHAGRMR